MNTVFLLFDQVEVLDFAGPLEVLGECLDDQGRPRFPRVFAAAQKSLEVEARTGLGLRAETPLESVVSADLVVIPGGRGTLRVVSNESVLAHLRRLAEGGAMLFSICTGAHVLAQAGLLSGLRATSHYAAIDRLEQAYPETTWLRDVRFVRDGQVLTSAGVSAGIDAAFALIAELHGVGAARQQAEVMEYRWSPETSSE